MRMPTVYCALISPKDVISVMSLLKNSTELSLSSTTDPERDLAGVLLLKFSLVLHLLDNLPWSLWLPEAVARSLLAAQTKLRLNPFSPPRLKESNGNGQKGLPLWSHGSDRRGGPVTWRRAERAAKQEPPTCIGDFDIQKIRTESFGFFCIRRSFESLHERRKQ